MDGGLFLVSGLRPANDRTPVSVRLASSAASGAATERRRLEHHADHLHHLPSNSSPCASASMLASKNSALRNPRTAARTIRAILTQCVNQRRDDGHERAHKQTYNQQPQEQVRLLHPTV